MASRQNNWRTMYRARRYMEHLSFENLARRRDDIILNMVTITGECKLGLIPVNEVNSEWMEKFTHVLEEYALRETGMPPLPEMYIPYPSRGLMPSAVREVAKHTAAPRDVIVKYSKAKYLRDALTYGRLRVQPAASYNDSSLNHAQRDNELVRSIESHPSGVRIEPLDRVTGTLRGRVVPIGNVKLTASATTNYYVYCLSSSFVPRLFCDFDADACLVIFRPDDFIERLQSAMDAWLPGWGSAAFPVKYFDPLLTGGEIGVFETKEFRFAYQKEVRVVWTPPAPVKSLPSIDVEIGSLTDIAKIVELEAKIDATGATNS